MLLSLVLRASHAESQPGRLTVRAYFRFRQVGVDTLAGWDVISHHPAYKYPFSLSAYQLIRFSIRFNFSI